MPSQGVDKPWYSVGYGPVHFTVMSTEMDWTSGSEQVSHSLLISLQFLILILILFLSHGSNVLGNIVGESTIHT